MVTFTGETDTQLMGDAFPVLLKGSEALANAKPKDYGLAVMAGSLNVMYANAFLQGPAELLPPERTDEKYAQLDRAKNLYLRGRDRILTAFDYRFKGFKDAALSGDFENFKPFMEKLKKKDVEGLFWMCSGWLAAFSLNPLDYTITPTVYTAVQLMRYAAELEPDYNEGGIWDVLTSVYAAAPPNFGGDSQQALYAHEQALRASKGKTIGPYITAVTAFCIPNNDSKGFDENLEKALAIDPNANENTRLQTIISRKKALYLKENKDNYIIDWGEE